MPYASDSTELLRLLPPIRRARFWRLYAEGGRRFLDLWADCGRSILGAKGTGLGTRAKASIDVGLTRPFPSVWERRLEKAVLAAYPGWPAARFYSSDEAALLGLERAASGGATAQGGTLRARGPALLDPAARIPGSAALGATPAESGEGSAASVAVLRPFGSFLPPSPPGAVAALPILPCPAALAPAALLFKDEALARAAGGELLPPLLLASAASALAEFARFSSGYGEALWSRSDRRLAPFFERRGPWLHARCAEEEYESFFRAALAGGALISPSWSLPSLLPGDFDDGELAALARSLEAART